MVAEPSENPLARLLELQAHDLHADQLRYQIEHHPSLAALEELHGRHRALAAQRSPISQQLESFDVRQAELEREIAEADQRIAAIDARLGSGQAGSYRDEEAMSEEMGSLARRKSQLEDSELEVMEEREPLDNELAEIAVLDHELEAEARRQSAAFTEAKQQLEAELAEEAERRASLTAGLQPWLLGEYDRLRERFGGIGAARIEHGSCSGCNLALSAGELDRFRHGASGEIFHCEQCGRILVP